MPRWPEAMAKAARTMTDATGCSIGAALAVLLGLVTGVDGPDQPERARAVEYLIRCNRHLTDMDNRGSS